MFNEPTRRPVEDHSISTATLKDMFNLVDQVKSAFVLASAGQTGSGKTFLMEGEPSAKDRAAWGLAPHAIYKVLQAVQKSSGKVGPASSCLADFISGIILNKGVQMKTSSETDQGSF